MYLYVNQDFILFFLKSFREIGKCNLQKVSRFFTFLKITKQKFLCFVNKYKRLVKMEWDMHSE